MQQDANKLKRILKTEMLRLKPINAFAFLLPAAGAGGCILLLLHPLLGNATNAAYVFSFVATIGIFLAAKSVGTQKHKTRLCDLNKTFFSPEGQILPVTVNTITTNPVKTKRTVEITNADGCFAFVPLKRWMRISEEIEKQGIKIKTLPLGTAE